MKNIIYTLMGLSCILTLTLFSCDEDGVRVEVKDQVGANSISALSTQAFVLDQENASASFEAFKWTKPDFGFQAGGDYTLQAAIAGTNFADALDIITTTSTQATLTVAQLNKALLDLGLSGGVAQTVEFRVRTVINANVAPVYSSAIQHTFTAYATSFAPIYIIGDAARGWDLAKPVTLRSSAVSVYEGVAQLTSGGKFRFFVTPSWTAVQYNTATFDGGSVDSKLTAAGDPDGNFIFNGTTGWYTIKVNTRTKSITLTSTTKPALYIIGDAAQGWDLNLAVDMDVIQDGEFEVTTSLTSGKKFRFFTGKDWTKGTINFPYFAGGTVDSNLASGNDSDGNFSFTGSDGQYKIRVNLYTKTISLTAVQTLSAIYAVGDMNGWSLDTPVVLNATGGNVFEGSITLSPDQIFRFFEVLDWSATQYNWTYFTSGSSGSAVDSRLVSNGDSDGNFKFTGTAGTYKITVNLTSKSIQLQQP